MKQPEQTKEEKTADLDELIEKDLIQKCKALQEENERLKELLRRASGCFSYHSESASDLKKEIKQALTGSQSKD